MFAWLKRYALLLMYTILFLQYESAWVNYKSIFSGELRYRQVPYLRQGGFATDHNHPIRVVNRYLTSSMVLNTILNGSALRLRHVCMAKEICIVADVYYSVFAI